MKICKAIFGEKLFGMIMKATFYGHFVAGEDRHKIVPTLERLSFVFYIPIVVCFFLLFIFFTINLHFTTSFSFNHLFSVDIEFEKKPHFNLFQKKFLTSFVSAVVFYV